MKTIVTAVAVAAFMATTALSGAEERREQMIPIVGTTLNNKDQIVGIVINIIVSVEKRDDADGLMVQFKGGFSPMAQTSSVQAIYRAAKVMGLSTDTWSVVITNPNPLPIYGDSLSAMIGITVVALARGIFILPGHILTGTITPDGKIGMVSAVPLKIVAAHQAHLSRILIPEEHDPTDFDWKTPFLMQVSPVRTVQQAYEALTTDFGERSER